MLRLNNVINTWNSIVSYYKAICSNYPNRKVTNNVCHQNIPLQYVAENSNRNKPSSTGETRDESRCFRNAGSNRSRAGKALRRSGRVAAERSVGAWPPPYPRAPPPRPAPRRRAAGRATGVSLRPRRTRRRRWRRARRGPRGCWRYRGGGRRDGGPGLLASPSPGRRREAVNYSTQQYSTLVLNFSTRH